MALPLRPSDTIVFIGDSITDAGRGNKRTPLGTGFVREFARLLEANAPELRVRVVNKGTGGDRSCDLVRRWSDDVVAQKPAWVVVYVGVNDVWRKFDRLADPVEVSDFEQFVRTMAERTASETEARLMLIEPFLAEKDPSDPFRADLMHYVEVVRRLAKERGAPVVRLQELFDAHMATTKPSKLAKDRVHPAPFGDRLIAEAVWRAFEQADP